MEGEGCDLLGCPKSTTVNVDTVTKIILSVMYLQARPICR